MAPGTRRNGKIDAQVEETFPASDPPSFMGGETLGAPPGRYTPRRMSSTIKRGKPAKKKAKTSTRKKRTVKKKSAAKKRKAATKKRKSR
jgi:hypothetical protein